MLNDRVRDLLNQINELEEELHQTLLSEQKDLLYKIEGSKIKFEERIKLAQRELKTGTLKWLFSSEPRHVITAPIIYAMILPIALLDLAFTLYQMVCFPLYRVPKVRRSIFITVDRQHLVYLNSIERINCTYCGYSNGVIAYCREIAARTEQFWCPIKHARKTLDPHRRYAKFAAFGDGENYREVLEELRDSLHGECKKHSPQK
ncbi:MAG: hypothetical protein ACU84Q_11800 [Gammaproteobacteria bacterium]